MRWPHFLQWFPPQHAVRKKERARAAAERSRQQRQQRRREQQEQEKAEQARNAYTDNPQAQVQRLRERLRRAEKRLTNEDSSSGTLASAAWWQLAHLVLSHCYQPDPGNKPHPLLPCYALADGSTGADGANAGRQRRLSKQGRTMIRDGLMPTDEERERAACTPSA